MKVLKYDGDILAQLLSNQYTSKNNILNKYHYQYLVRYLGPDGIDAKTIVFEDDYISKDFIHDYAEYYSLCFQKYPKFCKRIHFFKADFTEENFKGQILNPTDDFWNNYLGFVVVKPIPDNIIGYSLLSPYFNADTRTFFGVRDYNVHIFGVERTIKSLAFQEQDTVIAACATIAVWSMLNKAANNYGSILKTPNQITKDAGSLSFDGSRMFPNKGLSIYQICQSIYNSGLVCELKSADKHYENEFAHPESYYSNKYIAELIYSYSFVGIPIILIVNVPSSPATYGLHAITVSGYNSVASSDHFTYIENETVFKSHKIDKVYAHDDQFGPFVRVEFNGDRGIITPWTEKNGPITDIASVVIPLFPKIRISYEDIKALVFGFDAIFKFIFSIALAEKASFTWDIKLMFSDDYKSTIRESLLDDAQKVKLITQSLPKYVWVATLTTNGNETLKIVFDATNVSQSMIAVQSVCFMEEAAKEQLKKILINTPSLSAVINGSHGEEYLDFIIKNM